MRAHSYFYYQMSNKVHPSARRILRANWDPTIDVSNSSLTIQIIQVYTEVSLAQMSHLLLSVLFRAIQLQYIVSTLLNAIDESLEMLQTNLRNSQISHFTNSKLEGSNLMHKQCPNSIQLNQTSSLHFDGLEMLLSLSSVATHLLSFSFHKGKAERERGCNSI